MRAVIATAGVFVGIAGIVSCTEILGVSGTYQPISVAICACTDIDEIDRFGEKADECQATISRKLEEAQDGVVQGWIDQYKANDCDRCTNLRTCLAIAPLCAATNEACTGTSDCCADLACAPATGTCVPCAAPDQACSASAPCCNDGISHACDDTSNLCKRCSALEEGCDTTRDCCGFGVRDVYCDKSEGKGVCRAEPSTCKHDGETCASDEECCGYAVIIPVDPSLPDGPKTSAGTCSGTGANRRCVERCNPNDPTNCINCCAKQVLPLSPPVTRYRCVGGVTCSPPNCVDDPALDRCPEGTSCGSVTEDFILTYYCQ